MDLLHNEGDAGPEENAKRRGEHVVHCELGKGNHARPDLLPLLVAAASKLRRPLQPRPMAPYSVMPSRVCFILPALPELRASPPTGEGWSYEIKFDGFRAQLHNAGGATSYGKNGGDLTRRFPTIAAVALALPTKSCIIDGELIAASAGQPDSELDGRDLRDQPLEQRRAQLKHLLNRSKGDLIQYSDSFADPVVQCIGLEGVVCTPKGAPTTGHDARGAPPQHATMLGSLRAMPKSPASRVRTADHLLVPRRLEQPPASLGAMHRVRLCSTRAGLAWISDGCHFRRASQSATPSISAQRFTPKS